MSDRLPISRPGQCCVNHCVEDIDLHNVDRSSAEAVVAKVAEREAAARDEVFDEAWAESEPVEVEVRLRRPGRLPEHVKTWSAATTYVLPAPASRPGQ